MNAFLISMNQSKYTVTSLDKKKKFACLIPWIRMDGSRIRKEIVAVSKTPGYVLTGSYLFLYSLGANIVARSAHNRVKAYAQNLRQHFQGKL